MNNTFFEKNSEEQIPWYKTAVIYQLHVRSFCDSNGDGIGDFPGLTRALDYISCLGATALWLLPFCPSPLRDDGYDVSDYYDIHPSYGSLDDFDEFIKEAHKRNLKVITELVINHTSQEHFWFQRARRAPPGSDERDWYVWSETPEKFKDVRIIFSDFETSNWEWDPIAKAYYWHRFSSHQPDLNLNNSAVVNEVEKVLEFWLRRGVDGLRLDALPYLCVKEGTNCENLYETHAVIKRLRACVEERYPNSMLLAEANQWPEDLVHYFGKGDECHMAFHFPLMPRFYMALRKEDKQPIIEILARTPRIPERCQWAIFLRNHDELTLEMVTDEERDYLFREYAADPQTRLNRGIRRRLAPLLTNSRRRVELLNSLLLSFPGTPVIYYGDEIGMGDNVQLGDRDSVRTPMQWTSGPNAGFSSADSGRLFLPLVTDEEFGHRHVNVEREEQNPGSLLHFTRRLLHIRKRFEALSAGRMEIVNNDNKTVLSYMRIKDQQVILCVANLSRFVQPVNLSLTGVRGFFVREVVGGTQFPRVLDPVYFLSLGPHAFYWFELSEPGEAAAKAS